MTYSDDPLLIAERREREASRFRARVVLLVPLAAILFQVYVPRVFEFLEYLEIPLLVTVYFALMRRDPISGTLIGAAVGLAQDALSSKPLGMFGIVKSLVGYFAATAGLKLDVDHPVIRFFLALFFFFFHQFFFWVLSRALLSQPVDFAPGRTAVLALFNACVAVSLFHFLDKLRERS